MDKAVKNRRKGVVSLACQRCKARKTKCDGDFISGASCTSCTKVNEACVFNEQMKPNYVKMLQQRVDFLESKIKDLEESALKKDISSPGLDKSSSIDSSSPGSGLKKSIIECAAFIPLKNDDKTSVYVGGSGFSVAHMIEGYLLEDEAVADYPDADSGSNMGAQINLPKIEDIIKDEKLTSYYMENYLTIIHTRFPFLSRTYVESLHNNAYRLILKPKSGSVMDRFILLMVYAIGAYLKQDANSPDQNTVAHFSLYKHALSKDLKSVLQAETISNVHAILLLVIYKLRFPNGSTIWYLVGTALRLCIEFGLHRRNLEFFVSNPFAYLIQCRTFWSVYALEKVISNFFGRPFSINDRDIDIDLPIDIDESVTDDMSIKNKFYQTYPHLNLENFPVEEDEGATNTRTSISVAIIYFKLRQIDSKIHNKIYRVDIPFEDIPRQIIAEIQGKMKHWLDSLPSYLTKRECDYCLYLYNKQIRSLIVPFMNRLEANDPLFIECIKSSINICKLNRRIHDSRSSRHRLSIVSLQTIFLSGVTIIYGLFSRKVIWDFDVSEGLRSCSSTLVLLAERCPSCSQYRDAFEKLFEQVSHARSLQQGSLTSDYERPIGGLSSLTDSSDMFGQDQFIKEANKRHFIDNMKTFNTLANSEYIQEENFDVLFDFSDVDTIFRRLGNLNNNHSGLGIDL